nr:helicase-primase subunit [Macronycteris gammaherpesvirus 1]BEG23112.1 helicase-primase subunit [Macronycteris gammaherpesvirus 1]
MTTLSDLINTTALAVEYRKQETSVFLLWKTKYIFSGEFPASNCNENPSTWINSMNTAISLLLQPQHKCNPLLVLKKLTTLYFKERYNTCFWLVDNSFVCGTSVPPILPIDCLKPETFILTKQGHVCWHQQLQVPVTIDFMAYLKETLLCLCQFGGVEDKSKTLQALESFESILCLL